MAGNFSYVIKAYLGSPQFASLAVSTRYNWQRALVLAEAGLGSLSTDVVRPALVQAHLDELAMFPGKQEIAKTALKAVEKWAMVRDLLPYPITTGVQTIGSDGGHEPWTDDEIEIAQQNARPDLAKVVALAINTGQRGSDIVRMRWSDIEDQDGRKGIAVTQQKTGKRLWIPLTAEFSQRLYSWDKAPPFFLVLAPDGRQFTRNRLSHDWSIERDSNPALKGHKERGLVLHGLRASTVVRFRKMGFTELEISSYIGMSEPMVARYSRLANQKNMALATVERIENFRADRIKSLQDKPLKYKDTSL
jgi:integrase